MLPPPEGGGFVVTDSSPVPNEVRLKVPGQRPAQVPGPSIDPQLVGHTQSQETASHARTAKAKPRATRVEPRRDPSFPRADFGQAAGQGMLKPSPEGEGFNPPSK